MNILYVHIQIWCCPYWLHLYIGWLVAFHEERTQQWHWRVQSWSNVKKEKPKTTFSRLIPPNKHSFHVLLTNLFGFPFCIFLIGTRRCFLNTSSATLSHLEWIVFFFVEIKISSRRRIWLNFSSEILYIRVSDKEMASSCK